MSNKIDSNAKLAGKVFLRTILSTILCVFMFFSMSVLSLGILGKNVGYTIYETAENGEQIVVEEHTYAPGEKEIKKEDLPSGQYMEHIREVPDGVQTGVDIVVQIMMLFIVGAFPYGMLWSLGDRDANGVRFHRQKPQLWRGLLIGLLGNIPHFILYILLLLSKFGVVSPGYLGIYRLLNIPLLPYINGILANSTTLTSDASVWQLLGILPVVLVIPAVCCVAYILGYKEISLRERATYANISKGNPDIEV